MREHAAARGVPSGSQLHVAAIRGLFPHLPCDILCAADPDAVLPQGVSLTDYSGVVIGGSPLHAYDRIPEVQRQLQFVRTVADAGLPVFGSCWGLQVAAVLAGGQVRRCEAGREIGVARKITPLSAGCEHLLLSGKGTSFDALCIHYDEVTALDVSCTILARNSHSAVQAAIIPLGRSSIWAVQYHPEFDLQQIALLLRLYAPRMVEQGFFDAESEVDSFAGKWERLARDPDQKGLAWQLGLDQDTLSDSFRRREIRNWIEHCVLNP